MKVKKILLSKWVPWFFLIIIIPFLLLSYTELKSQKDQSFTSLVIKLILFTLILLVLFFISYRQIPYSLLVEEVRR